MRSDYPNEPGFKVGGTSQAAAESMKPSANILREKVREALERFGPLTADECASRLDVSILSIRPRFTELKTNHAITDTGRRRANASGRSATVWALAA